MDLAWKYAYRKSILNSMKLKFRTKGHTKLRAMVATLIASFLLCVCKCELFIHYIKSVFLWCCFSIMCTFSSELMLYHLCKSRPVFLLFHSSHWVQRSCGQRHDQSLRHLGRWACFQCPYWRYFASREGKEWRERRFQVLKGKKKFFLEAVLLLCTSIRLAIMPVFLLKDFLQKMTQSWQSM